MNKMHRVSIKATERVKWTLTNVIAHFYEAALSAGAESTHEHYELENKLLARSQWCIRLKKNMAVINNYNNIDPLKYVSS